jgi:predicted nucleic acid-binding protein
MAAVAADTSFLFSLYGRDAHTAKALATVLRLGVPLTLTALNEFELQNAVRFAVFRGLLARDQADLILEAFASDLAGGRLVMNATNLSLVIEEAKRLSASYTEQAGHRSFDLLHVAAALHLSARAFLSFDDRQRSLAAKSGLKVLPASI